ncbi:hypothetical protein, partial [Salmonella enterica]|uniref:hypothetical protein n=1 Tax=Salmonella enterica TaxID=28901 RepID=UPI002FCDBF35
DAVAVLVCAKDLDRWYADGWLAGPEERNFTAIYGGKIPYSAFVGSDAVAVLVCAKDLDRWYADGWLAGPEERNFTAIY